MKNRPHPRARPVFARRPLVGGMVALALFAPVAGPISAQSPVPTGRASGGPLDPPIATARLIPGAPEADGTRVIGLELDLAPGWKTYWRSPGEAGVPPVFDWSGSGNVAEVEVFWPAPAVFQSFGLTTVGYADRVIFPVGIAPSDPSAPIDLDLALDLGVCRDVCVLERLALRRSIPTDAVAGGGRIAEALALVPVPGREAGLTRAACAIRGAGAERAFSADLTFDRALDDPQVFLEGPEGVWFHSVRVAGDGGRVDVEAALSLLSGDAWISRGDVRLTVLAEGLAADIQGCGAPAG